MRSIFEEFGEITRLYLSEEDKTVRKNRRANGGNGSKQVITTHPSLHAYIAAHLPQAGS